MRDFGAMPRPRLSVLEREARERMRLVTPENAGKVVYGDIFWTVPFLELYLEKCDDLAFEDPQQARLLARHAPRLAEIIGVGARPGEYRAELHKRSFRVHALAVFAGICRATGRLTEARAHYRHAFDLLADGPVTARAEAELRSRFALLQLQVREFEDSLANFNRSAALFEDDPPGLAQALVLRAGWHWRGDDAKSAGLDLVRALAEAAKNPTDRRSNRAVIHGFNNLTRLLAENLLPLDERSQAMALIREARKRLSRARTSRIKMKLLWAEGTLSRRHLFTPYARRLLMRARAGFRRLEIPDDFAIISLEIAVLLHEEGDFEELEALRKDTISAMAEMTPDPLLLETLAEWRVKMPPQGLLELEQNVRRQST